MVLKIDTLNKSYKLNMWGSSRLHALSGINLDIRRNEIVSLLGENGAGKTTLISILTGLLNFDRGDVLIRPSVNFYKENLDTLNQKRSTINEEEVEHVAEQLNRDPLDLSQDRDLCRNLISVCPQYDLLWMELSVEENMRLVGLFKGIPPELIDREIDAVLTKTKLLSEKKNTVASLSGGMRRRISIGLALLGNSEVVILDEPTTGLDPVNRKQIWQFIRELKNNGKSILLTTHIMDEADFLSDRVAIINKGKLLKVADTVGIKSEFQLLNFIISIDVFSQKGCDKVNFILESIFGENNFEVKYQSTTLMKINIPSGDQAKVRQLVQWMDEWVGLDTQSGDSGDNLADFIENYELASLDLEEAYMMLNQKHEATNLAQSESQ